MRLRRSVVEHRFATIKYRIFGHPRLLLRGRVGAHTELSLAVMAYNLKRMANVIANAKLTQVLQKNLSKLSSSGSERREDQVPGQ